MEIKFKGNLLKKYLVKGFVTVNAKLEEFVKKINN